jgi:hypothetical protein
MAEEFVKVVIDNIESTPKTKKRVLVPVTDPVDKRVLMINGRFNLPDKTLAVMNNIRIECDSLARNLAIEVKSVEHDTGRLIATIDLLQQLKNVACDAVILPHATMEV